ncbi:MAG: hypothetical protein ACMUIL_08340 [bacterium]
MNAFPGLDALEQGIGSSIQYQTRAPSQFFSFPYSYGGFFSPWSSYSSYYTPWSYTPWSPFGSFYSPWSGASSFLSYPSFAWGSPWGSWGNLWSSPWSSPWGYQGNYPGIYPGSGSSSPYPAGTLYGLVKRSHLKA